MRFSRRDAVISTTVLKIIGKVDGSLDLHFYVAHPSIVERFV